MPNISPISLQLASSAYAHDMPVIGAPLAMPTATPVTDARVFAMPPAALPDYTSSVADLAAPQRVAPRPTQSEAPLTPPTPAAPSARRSSATESDARGARPREGSADSFFDTLGDIAGGIIGGPATAVVNMIPGGNRILGTVGQAIAAGPAAVLGGIAGVGGAFAEGGNGGAAATADDWFERVLSQYGATPEFIRRAQAQLRAAAAATSPEGAEAMDPDAYNALATDVLNGMIQQWQSEQSGGPYDPFGDARERLASERETQLANIAAAQAWMQPLMTEMLNKAQWYADQQNTMGMALANQVSDPALAAAMRAMSTQYSSDQAVQNALMLQQAALSPQYLTDQLNSEYQQILQDLALQEAQYNNEILAAGGTLPGQSPIVGGIPLVPMPGAPPQPQYNPLSSAPTPQAPPPNPALSIPPEQYTSALAVLATLPPDASPTQIIQALVSAGVSPAEAERIAQQETGQTIE